MSFNSKVIQQGNLIKKQAEETPTSFATTNGASDAEPTGSLDKKNQVRMAGPGGAFAMKMMTDPEFAMRVQNWDSQFIQSNQGMMFNKAKIMMGGLG